MSSQYKENNFSLENRSTSHNPFKKNTNETARPNIDDLIKRILNEKRRERRNTLTLGFVVLSLILIFFFFQY